MNTIAWLTWAPGDTGTSFWSTKLVEQCVLQLKGRKARCLPLKESFRWMFNSCLVLYDPPPWVCGVTLKQMCGQHNTLPHSKPLMITHQSPSEVSWLSQDKCFSQWALTEGLGSKWEWDEGGYHLLQKSWRSLSQGEAYNQSITRQNSDAMRRKMGMRHLQSTLFLQGSAAVPWQ